MRVLSEDERTLECNKGEAIRREVEQTLTEEKVLKALRKVQRKLRTGEIDPIHFNMETCADKTSCGTVGCIGGWLGLELIGVKRAKLRHTWAATNIMDDATEVVKTKPGLHALFYHYSNADYRARTPKEAVKAITEFFKGERHPWQALDAKAKRSKAKRS